MLKARWMDILRRWEYFRVILQLSLFRCYCYLTTVSSEHAGVSGAHGKPPLRHSQQPLEATVVRSTYLSPVFFLHWVTAILAAIVFQLQGLDR